MSSTFYKYLQLFATVLLSISCVALHMISAKLFLALLDILHKKEWKSISALAKLAGISPSTFSRIVNGQTKEVQADTVGQLGRALGYKITLSESDQWTLERESDKSGMIKEGSSLYNSSHRSETESGLSPEDVKLLDSLSMQLSQIARQIDELKKKKTGNE